MSSYLESSGYSFNSSYFADQLDCQGGESVCRVLFVSLVDDESESLKTICFRSIAKLTGHDFFFLKVSFKASAAPVLRLASGRAVKPTAGTNQHLCVRYATLKD